MATADPLAVCDAVIELVDGRAEAIVTTTTGTSALTRFANSSIHQNVAEDLQSVVVKVILDGRAASASTTQTDTTSLTNVVDRALEAARLRPPDPDWPGLATPQVVPDVQHWDEATASAEPAARAAVVQAFVEADAELEAAGYCSTFGVHHSLVNSAGVRLAGRYSGATINGIHRTGSSDGSATQTSVSVAELEGGRAGAEASETARDGRQPIEIRPGNYEVVLSPSCLANMLLFLSYAGFNAKAYLDGTSFVHLGEHQFDESISIWDDATDARTIGLPFDEEGTPKRRVDLVQKGVTTSLVHDRRTAKKLGAESTGHGIGSESAGAHASNLFLGEGERARHNLIASIERGLLVCDFWYTRILDPRTQVVTGLTRNGVFMIEDGKLRSAVENLRFTQSFVAALGPGKVRGIGNDANLVDGMHVPSVHLAGWNFTGGAKG